MNYFPVHLKLIHCKSTTIKNINGFSINKNEQNLIESWMTQKEVI